MNEKRELIGNASLPRTERADVHGHQHGVAEPAAGAGATAGAAQIQTDKDRATDVYVKFSDAELLELWNKDESTLKVGISGVPLEATRRTTTGGSNPAIIVRYPHSQYESFRHFVAHAKLYKDTPTILTAMGGSSEEATAGRTYYVIFPDNQRLVNDNGHFNIPKYTKEKARIQLCYHIIAAVTRLHKETATKGSHNINAYNITISRRGGAMTAILEGKKPPVPDADDHYHEYKVHREYLAPEFPALLESGQTLDQAQYQSVDIFALGATCVNIMAGAVHRDHADLQEQIDNFIPQRLRDIMRQMVNVEPKQRPTAAAILEAFDRELIPIATTLTAIVDQRAEHQSQRLLVQEQAQAFIALEGIKEGRNVTTREAYSHIDLRKSHVALRHLGRSSVDTAPMIARAANLVHERYEEAKAGDGASETAGEGNHWLTALRRRQKNYPIYLQFIITAFQPPDIPDIPMPLSAVSLDTFNPTLRDRELWEIIRNKTESDIQHLGWDDRCLMHQEKIAQAVAELFDAQKPPQNMNKQAVPDVTENAGTDPVTGDPIRRVKVLTLGAPRLFIRIQAAQP